MFSFCVNIHQMANWSWGGGEDEVGGREGEPTWNCVPAHADSNWQFCNSDLAVIFAGSLLSQ